MVKAVFSVLLVALSLNVSAQSRNDDSICMAKAKELIFDVNNDSFGKAVSLFDETASGQVNAVVLKTAWSQVFSKLGSLKSLGKPRSENDDATTIVYIPCIFEDATVDLKAHFSDSQKILGFSFVPHTGSGAYRLPAYADTSMVKEMDITIVSGKFRLPGMYIYPKTIKEQIPVVVLVHGSGPNDMDETIESNKPFKDMAYALAKQGIGVVRYDKRTKVYGNQMIGETDLTLERETIIDAISAARLARKLAGVDSNHIFIIGHSLGAMAAPLIAQQAGNLVAGIVLMAGPARPLETLLLEQNRYLDSLVPSGMAKKKLDVLKGQVEMVNKGDFGPKTPSSQLPMGLTAGYWLFLHHYHQAEVAAKLKIPILVLQGERDYQVRMTDYNLWKKALAKSKRATFYSYPSLNHLFMEGVGASTPAEYDTPGHVAEYVNDDIVKWLKAN